VSDSALTGTLAAATARQGLDEGGRAKGRLLLDPARQAEIETLSEEKGRRRVPREDGRPRAQRSLRGRHPRSDERPARLILMASQDLPNTTNPDDWAKIAGRKGERIVHVKSLPRGTEKSRSVDTVVAIGQYL
jgi:hypothetical protein